MSDLDQQAPSENPLPQPAEGRNFWGWIALVVMLSLYLGVATVRKEAPSPDARRAAYAARLSTAIRLYEAGDNPIAKFVSGSGSPTEELERLERDSAPGHRTDATDAAVWAVVRAQLGKPVLPADTVKVEAPLSEAFRPGKSKDPGALARRLDARGPFSKVAANQVRQRAGLAVVKRGPNRVATALGGLLILGIGFGSLVSWVILAGLGLSGNLQLLGPATEARTSAEADRLAACAATLFGTFLALSIVMGYILPGNAGTLATSGAMLLVVPIVLRRKPSMAEVGLNLRHLGRDALLGVWGFLLELPVTGILAVGASLLLRNLPRPEHPAATALQNSPSLATILAMLFAGAIVAPYWEETMFRGLLFPAMRRFVGPTFAALASSFVFASIHPQGPVLWAALAGVALFSCLLAQNTRSLVPSVVMHFCHNATLLTLAILVGGG